MKIINNGDFGGCNKRIVVGSEAEKPKGMQHFELGLFETFLKGEKDVASTTDFDAPYIHIDLAGPAWLDRTDAYRPREEQAFAYCITS